MVDEIEYLHNTFGADTFTFYDDAFTVDQSRVEEICREIHDRKLRITWDCGTRVDMVTKDLLQKMKDAGCIAVWYGVEAGSQRIIDAMGKGFTANKTKKAFKSAKEVGLMTIASVVFGFPGETRKTAMETIKLVEEISPDDIGYYIATPYPGSRLFDICLEKKFFSREFSLDDLFIRSFIIETPDWDEYMLRKMFLKGKIYLSCRKMISDPKSILNISLKLFKRPKFYYRRIKQLMNY